LKIQLKGQSGVHLLMLLTMAVWGLTFTAGKIAGEQASPLNATLWRFILAGLFLTPLAAKAPKGLAVSDITLFGWLGLVLSGLTGLVLYNFFFIKGLTLTTASRASVVVCISPALIYLGSIFFFKEKLTALRCTGLIISAIGTVWAVTSGKPQTLLDGGLGRGELIVLGCPLTWTAYSLLGKFVLKSITPLNANTFAVLSAVVLLLPLVFISGEKVGEFTGYSAITWLSLAFLGLGGTALGFTVFYKGIMALGPPLAAAYINLVPVFGILFGWLILGESLDLSLFMGLGLILFGIRLVHKH
jgi:drug/metabolite transporter (DMT)-like permease